MLLSKVFVSLLALMTAALLFGCGGGSDSDMRSFAPPESPWPKAYLRYVTPPSGFTAALGWMQAIEIQGRGTACVVEVAWMRLFATVPGSYVLLLEDNFDVYSKDHGGLFTRNPWFTHDMPAMLKMPFALVDNTMVIEPSRHPGYVYHWWNSRRALVPQNTDRVWFEALVRITGGCGVQAGIDYWRDLNVPYAGLDVNNTEAGVSDWYGNSTNNWQLIRVGVGLQ